MDSGVWRCLYSQARIWTTPRPQRPALGSPAPVSREGIHWGHEKQSKYLFSIVGVGADKDSDMPHASNIRIYKEYHGIARYCTYRFQPDFSVDDTYLQVTGWNNRRAGCRNDIKMYTCHHPSVAQFDHRVCSSHTYSFVVCSLRIYCFRYIDRDEK